MKITDARRLLTHRHSRIHDASGMIYIGLSLEDAEAIAGLLPIVDETPVPEWELIPEAPESPLEPERVEDPRYGLVSRKKAKKKTKKGRKR